jgi:light-independent protochlorophyllide reductase subunit B
LYEELFFFLRLKYMKLSYWMYSGPAHIGTLRVASSFKNVHAIMHAPLGDDYFNVLRSMLEREREFTPTTASIVDRRVLARGSQEKVVDNITRKDTEDVPDLILVTPTCTSSILQEDLQNFVNRAFLDAKADVLLADVNHYRVTELQAADRTFEQVVHFYLDKAKKNPQWKVEKTRRPSVNILGMFTLGFHNQHDTRELRRLLNDLGVDVNLVLPEGVSVHDIQEAPNAWVNVVPYREIGLMAARYLENEWGMPYTTTIPMGLVDTAQFIRQLFMHLRHCSEEFFSGEVSIQTEEEIEAYIDNQSRFVSQASWFGRSIDCQNLTGKKVVVFGDATHAALMTKILSREIGIRVSCAGTYCKNESDWFREQVHGCCDEILITDDHTQVGDVIARIEPAAIFGSQMERHIGKRLEIPCGVISAPVHIQNFPLGFKPFLGYEGTNQIADLVYNSFTLGMEDHLLEIFGGHDTKEVIEKSLSTTNGLEWAPDGLAELQKVPGFVRGKIKRNTEKFAKEQGIQKITVEVMYAAKEAVGA